MNEYEYTSLGTDEIRVLEVLSVKDDGEPLRCNIRKIRLEVTSATGQQHAASTEFVTLSYTWGRTYSDGSHLTEEIWCDGGVCSRRKVR